MGASIIAAIIAALELTNTIFQGSNDKKKKEHAVRAKDIALLLKKETLKPMEEWIHSDIELWTAEAMVLIPLASAEVKAYANK